MTESSRSVDVVLPQDCGFFKGLGCALGPISWCALSSFGGSSAFCDCVDRASGGNCIDCTGCGTGRGLDPRAHDAPLTAGPTSGGGTGGPPPGHRCPHSCTLQRQLNRIWKCACGMNPQDPTEANGPNPPRE